jgi:hypothetical protein
MGQILSILWEILSILWEICYLIGIFRNHSNFTNFFPPPPNFFLPVRPWLCGLQADFASELAVDLQHSWGPPRSSYDRQATFLKRRRQTTYLKNSDKRQLLTGKRQQIVICVMGQKWQRHLLQNKRQSSYKMSDNYKYKGY